MFLWLLSYFWLEHPVFWKLSSLFEQTTKFFSFSGRLEKNANFSKFSKFSGQFSAFAFPTYIYTLAIGHYTVFRGEGRQGQSWA